MVDGVVEDAADASPSFPFPALALISQLPALLADNLWDTFFSRDNCLAISMLFCLLQTLAYWHTGRISALEPPHGIRLKLHSCLDHVPACYISPAPSSPPPQPIVLPQYIPSTGISMSATASGNPAKVRGERMFCRYDLVLEAYFMKTGFDLSSVSG